MGVREHSYRAGTSAGSPGGPGKNSIATAGKQESMNRSISPAVWDRMLEDTRGLGWDRYMKLVPSTARRWIPYMIFGGIDIPLPGKQALLIIPGGAPTTVELSVSIYWKTVRQEGYAPEGSTLTNLTRAEADYLDRLDSEVLLVK